MIQFKDVKATVERIHGGVMKTPLEDEAAKTPSTDKGLGFQMNSYMNCQYTLHELSGMYMLCIDMHSSYSVL